MRAATPNLRTLSRKGDCAVIVAVGFLMTDAVKQVADEYPDQLYAIIGFLVIVPSTGRFTHSLLRE